MKEQTPPPWWKTARTLSLLLSAAWRQGSRWYFDRARKAIQAKGLEGAREALTGTDTLGYVMGRLVTKKPLTLLLLMLREGAPYWAARVALAKAGQKAEGSQKDDHQDRIAHAVTRQIQQFAMAHPDRILQPEIERQLQYLADSNLTTMADVSDVLDRLEALSNQDTYWDRLSDVQVARAWHAQGVLMGRDGGITRAAISGPDDEKTCAVCKRMIGLEFDVPAMADKIEADLGLEDLDDYIDAWTFPRAGDVDNISREALAAQMRFPPYHPHCRHSVALLY